MNVSPLGQGTVEERERGHRGPGVGGSGPKNSDGKGQKFPIKFEWFVKPEVKFKA